MKCIGIIVWFGVGFLILGIFSSFITSISISLSENIEIGSVVSGYGIAWFSTMLGVFLVFLGGFATKPRRLWMYVILIGFVYILSSYQFLFSIIKSMNPLWYDLFLVIMALLPGLLLIAGGIMMKLLTSESKD